MPELDSVRGIAVLLVLTFHGFRYNFGRNLQTLHGMSPIESLGRLGVDLFFVLSGFLITGILLDSRSRPDYFRRFYIRRALRILPLFYLVLLLLYPLSRSGLLGDRHVGWQFIALSSVYLCNLVSFFGVPSQFTVLWSLAVEEQFYLVWPWLVRAVSRRGIMLASLALVLACPAIRAFAYLHGYQYAAGFTWLIADEIAIGALLAGLSRGWAAERGKMLRCSILLLGGGIAMLACGAPFGIFFTQTLIGGTFRISAFNLLFAAALGLFLFLGTGPFKWMVHRPVLQFFGDISYGLYLIHTLVFDMVDHFVNYFFPSMTPVIFTSLALSVVRFMVGAGGAVLVAFLSRKYFESYFLSLKARWAPGNPKDTVAPKEYAMAAVAD